MEQSKQWWLPLTGIVAVVLVVVALVVSGEPPDPTEESIDETVAFYVDDEDAQFAGGILFGLAAVFFLFFAGWLRRILRDAEGPGGILSAVFFAGAIVFAVATAAGATIQIALADLADDLDPVAVQALNGLSWDWFIPFAVGGAVLLFAAGLSIIRHGALPSWLGWVALVLGVASYTPAGFFAFVGSGVWYLIVGIMGAARARGGGAPPTGVPPA